jgi:hypothetical protein
MFDSIAAISSGRASGGRLANLVSQEESVRAVVAKVALGEADAGIVYVSDAASQPELGRIELPAEHNPMAEYPMAALRASPHASAARAFIEFVLSGPGQRILEEHGFRPLIDSMDFRSEASAARPSGKRRRPRPPRRLELIGLPLVLLPLIRWGVADRTVAMLLSMPAMRTLSAVG